MAKERKPSTTLDPAATDQPGENALDGAKKRRDPNEPSAVVGLGASAGGIAPLQQFFSDMDPKSGLAFVVVMHLSPEYESQLANVLQQKTTMPVTQVSEPVRVRPNHVYVIPPNHQLTFDDSTLHLVPPQQPLGRRVTIDLFFRTLAQAYGQRAVCIILSGTDSDGVIGLKHVRAQGGLTIVQDPDEAEHSSMPATAISTGMVDWVMPVGKMAPKLLEFSRNEMRMKLPPEIPGAEEEDAKVKDAPGGPTISEETHDPEDEEAISEVLDDVRIQTGHDFTHYKRATVLRRIARRMQVNSIETLPKYLEFIRTHAVEVRALLQDLLIGVTHFFRDRDAFAALEAHIPQLFAGKKKDDEVRVWVAGCATGEEAYSVAMLLCEHANRLSSSAQVQIFATDIDEQAIADARDGLYPSMIEADVSPERLREFFVRDQGRYRVRKEIREKILFAAHDLLKDAPFSRCDLICCRNLLIYLTGKAQAQVVDVFHFSLRSGGLLFIGGSENHSQAQSLFSSVDPKHRLFVRRSTPRPIWKVPLLPLRAPMKMFPTRPVRTPRILPPLTATGAGQTTSDADVQMVQAGQARREVLFGELHLRLLEQYGPASVVVNEKHEIVHLSESAGRYLHFAAGEPTANLVKVIHPGLQIELRTALFRADQSRTAVKSTPQRIEIESANETITLEVRPMATSDEAQGFFLVLFEKEGEPPPGTIAAPITPPSTAAEAEDEAQFLKQQLNTTVEQYEAANEELKASNEELQAMNEELRSATEELETSKEELQSVNEELSTVNHELKNSVEELSRTNADLNNLMASSDIGTIFLDRQLRIHRFTPAAQRIFNLIPADMGRPISDITSNLSYEGFIADAEKVLHELTTIECEMQLGDQSWFMTRIAPYQQGDDRIAGVVATFIDISRRKAAEDEVRESEARVRRAMEIETVGIIFFTLDGRITDANGAFLSMSGYSREDLEGGRVRWDKMTPMEWMTVTRQEMDRVSRVGKIGPYEKQYIRKDGTRWWGLFTGTRLGDDFGVEYVLDISDKRAAEEALRESEERFRTVADNVPQVIWTNDPGGQITYFNRRWYEYTGQSLEESVTSDRGSLIHPEDLPAVMARWDKALAEGEVFEAEYRLREKDGGYRWFIGRNVPLRQDGRILSWFGSATDIEDYKKSEARLRASEERFRVLVEGARDYAMFLLDPSNIITFWSKGAERVFGWTQEEAVGQSGNLIFTPEDKAKGAVEKEIDIALAEGRAPDRRYHLRKDGSRFWADGVLMRLNDERGELRGFAKVARDANDQRAAEDELRHSKDEMEQRVLERTRDLLATNAELERTMSQRQELERELLEISEREKRRIGEDLHDIICQELTATALFLKSTAKKADRKEGVGTKALNEAAEIVNRNVTLARNLARGLQPADLSAGKFTSALRELVTQTRENHKIDCRLDLPRPIQINDEVFALNLYRIAQEAITNAVKHSQATKLNISLRREGDNLRLSVQDNGIGFRSRSRAKGLGMHIMRYRTSVLGGTFEVESEPKAGSTVTCIVPVRGAPGRQRKKRPGGGGHRNNASRD